MSAELLAPRGQGAVADFAHALVQATFNRALHPRDSSFVTEAMRDVVAALAKAAAPKAMKAMKRVNTLAKAAAAPKAMKAMK